MDLKEIEKLIEMLENSKMTRLAIRKEGFEIELEKEVVTMAPMHMMPSHHREQVLPEATVVPQLASSTSSGEHTIEGRYITSPMVGTLYLTPAPGDPPFIKVGDLVDESSVVCIIEAMKVMNEVKAQMSGKIVEVLIKSGEPVEFGTKLFKVV